MENLVVSLENDLILIEPKIITEEVFWKISIFKIFVNIEQKGCGIHL